MKRLFVFAVIIGALMGQIAYANFPTLYRTYIEQTGSFPPLETRKFDAEACGIPDYKGTFLQNIKLNDCLRNEFGQQNLDDKILGVAPVDRLSKTIREDISAGVNNTDIDVDPLVTLQGHRLIFTDFGGDRLFFRIGSGDNITWGYCTSMTDNTTYYTLSGCQLGLDDWGVSSTPNTANINAHSAGEPFVITNQHHWYSYYLFDKQTTSTMVVSSSVEFASSSLILGNNATTKNKCFFIKNGDSNVPFMCYNETAGPAADGAWTFSNNGVDTFAVPTTTTGVAGAGLGILVTNSIVSLTVAPTSTSGLGYLGKSLIIVTSTNGGITQNVDGLVFNTSSTIRWFGAATWIFDSTNTVRFGTSVIQASSTANAIVQAQSNGTIEPSFLPLLQRGDLLQSTTTDGGSVASSVAVTSSLFATTTISAGLMGVTGTLHVHIDIDNFALADGLTSNLGYETTTLMMNGVSALTTNIGNPFTPTQSGLKGYIDAYVYNTSTIAQEISIWQTLYTGIGVKRASSTPWISFQSGISAIDTNVDWTLEILSTLGANSANIMTSGRGYIEIINRK